MKITKESIQKMIILEFDNLNRELSTQDQSIAQAGSIVSGYSQSEVTVVVDTLARMNRTIDEDQTLSSIEIQDIVNMIKDNIIPAVNTLSSTVNRKFKEAYPESGE
jgi:hypothetical protein|tara:strand:+ start:251 stop:568 length:318 start_codon:yes stop_codon:yes gene_type:complete